MPPQHYHLLLHAGEINATAYNLWLNDDHGGHFLFSSVNKAKYTDLVTFYIPLTDPSDNVPERLIEGFGGTNAGNSTSIDFYPRPVLLDLGIVMSPLSQDMMLRVMTSLDGVIKRKWCHGAL
ncbi:hypothetical protein FVEN_g996 [Fusarium venenatum]|uniref:Uncharacterized protein n=1 Tax=Fusarium venenatum TaxID=56646 RepID=A0A2L2THQ2_9HYPO|nr:uncharacterized protein FVRRES_10579 [Fusarium venenatum]KAG8361664.1 hypothetical protein FVEN_g996 [Fusarium venenatum]CEI70502.1 unnamed protein product [Fusarium venenatum]